MSAKEKSTKPKEKAWEGRGAKSDEMVRHPLRKLAFDQGPKSQENGYSILGTCDNLPLSKTDVPTHWFTHGQTQ